ncbi:PfkB family carbohydrate kinase [Micromonospora humidisoli]|uniref:Bifunctional hydroxymethylpyrimidine kinase/phosphomethylpyrimidine kinase n=1 Tax=Micromonospora humidisoli TaxID=2807622 RepID=A0ABS2JKJ1_9ACTN|nr:PfkB family carbohydrate kinase [Micromonospora humidisoli]MBM7086904.1 bifunctional hydroxymethylpyrimidine kinase/phosphomethylpyrimidine kinase [Micromonospora humidisoli]
MTDHQPDGTSPPPPQVIVVGRANIDITVRIPRRPQPGRTTFASAPATTTAGGKSLNQARAAAGAGARTTLVANAGTDEWGTFLRRALTDAGVDVSHFQLIPSAPTGVAIVEVTPDAENHIVLALSPATELTADQVRDALRRLHAPTVLTQLDLPPDAVDAVIQHHRAETLIGNLVPHAALGSAVLAALDLFVCNEHEAAAILGRHHADPTIAAQELCGLGPRVAVVTAGARGAAYSTAEHIKLVPAPHVHAIDTTGAGDQFLGTLAARLAQNTPLGHAVADAVSAATAVVRA